MKIVTDKCRKQTHTHTCGWVCGGIKYATIEVAKKALRDFRRARQQAFLRVALNLACQAGARPPSPHHPTLPLPPSPSLPLLACPFYVASRKKKEFTAVLLPGDSNREQLTAQSRNDSPTTILHSTHTHTHTPPLPLPLPSAGVILKWFMCLPAAFPLSV